MSFILFFLKIQRPQSTPRPDTLFPYTTHFRSSPYIGGGLGGKLFIRADAMMAALGAKAAKRPVKIALPRPFIANNTTHRPATIQRIRLGATKDGKITAIGHESWSGDLHGGGPETAVGQTSLLYAGPNRMPKMRLAELDMPEGQERKSGVVGKGVAGR